ncbi:MAG: hypothetical protein ACRDAM_15935 [Casimicrobium sp.]
MNRKVKSPLLVGSAHAAYQPPPSKRCFIDTDEIKIKHNVPYPGPRNDMASKYDAILSQMQIGSMAECPSRGAANAMVKAAIKWAKITKKNVIFRTAVIEGKNCVWMLEAPKQESQIEALQKSLAAIKGKT